MTDHEIKQAMGRTRDRALEVLKLSQRRACAYIGDRCDCKYGVSTKTMFGPSEGGNGCPEFRDAIALIETVLPNVVAELEKLKQSKLPEVPELEGCYPVVLYLKNKDEADSLIAAVLEVHPNMTARQL